LLIGVLSSEPPGWAAPAACCRPQIDEDTTGKLTAALLSASI